MVFESKEENVCNYNDVERWIYLNSIPLHDPSGRLHYLRKQSAEYPAFILNRKMIRHYWLLSEIFGSTKNPLERADKETVSLLCIQGLDHLLKYCILAEGKPYPYTKWLYRVAMETRLGKLLREYIDALFKEIHKGDIVYEKPSEYVKPGHRNELLENYRIYHIVTEMRAVFEANRPRGGKDKYALNDRIGAWKPR
jgi:hypothetical protein